VNSHERPLALYYFDHNAGRIDHVLQNTISGGVTINDVIYHIAQNNLPFGGVGASGMGHYHGRAGFETFSKKKAFFCSRAFSTLKFLRPPYVHSPIALFASSSASRQRLTKGNSELRVVRQPTKRLGPHLHTW
jgi:hypothetical protein